MSLFFAHGYHAHNIKVNSTKKHYAVTRYKIYCQGRLNRNNFGDDYDFIAL